MPEQAVKDQSSLSRRGSLSRGETAIAVVVVSVVAFLLPAAYGFFNGLPIPRVHDEFGYLLSADTFANGRVTNPAAFSPESFEAPHVLVRPSYMSKYPPMQGLFLAAGQVVFGHPAFGVWLSCGFAAAALFWMLLAWGRPGWAILATGMMIAFLGVNHYWAQSFWGGMVAAGGGALFLGGVRRLFERVSSGASLLMTVGGIILVNSRPLEGTAMMALPLLVLAGNLLTGGKRRMQSIRLVVLPATILTVLALSGMAYYNFRATGQPFRFAYTEHQSQYFSTPLFVFLTPSGSELAGTPRLKSLYNHLSVSEPLRNLDELGLPRSVWIYPFYALAYLSVYLPFSFLGPPLAFLALITVPLRRADRWVLLAAGTVVFTMCCMSMAAYWDNMHYAAPLVPLFFFLAAEGMRFFYEYAAAANKRAIAIAALIILAAGSAIYQQVSIASLRRGDSSDRDPIALDLNRAENSESSVASKAASFKHRFEQMVDGSPDRYLAFVSYDDGYDLHDDMVFNRADLEAANVIWANDLGSERNDGLISHYPGRRSLLVHVGGGSVKVRVPGRSELVSWR